LFDPVLDCSAMFALPREIIAARGHAPPDPGRTAARLREGQVIQSFIDAVGLARTTRI
jgi:hypothetical protein